MNKTLTNLAVFVAGIAVGSIATWAIVKKKYEQIANEEIKSVKEVFYNKGKRDQAHEEIDIRNQEVGEYEDLVEDLSYASDDDEEEEDHDMDGPYVISPAEFGEHDFETSTLTYYADGVLTDEVDDIIEDVDDVVGSDSLTHFGEYEDDSVFVRNEKYRLDYEILLDPEKYYDKYPKK